MIFDFDNLSINGEDLIKLSVGDYIIWEKKQHTPTGDTPTVGDDTIYWIDDEMYTVSIIGTLDKGIIPKEVTKVIIGKTVTDIGYYAFEYNTSLSSVTIPSSVRSIENGAFFACTELSDVAIPYSVKNIGKNAFVGCKITNITIPQGVTKIEEGVFHSCENLSSVTIPDSVTSIGWMAFDSCTKLTSVTIPNSVVSIGTAAFRSCTNLTKMIIPDSVTIVGNEAFLGCAELSSITLSNNLIEFGNNVGAPEPDEIDRGYTILDGCFKLTEITFPKSLQVFNGGFSTNTSIETLRYNGSKAEWEELKTANNFTYNGISVIYCTDGEIYNNL